MMTKLFPIIFIFFFLYSCGSSEDEGQGEDKLEDNFTISGDIEGASNTNIYLEALSQQGSITVAEGKVESNGKFKLVGNIPGMGIYQLRLGESQDRIIPMTLVPDDKVKLRTSFGEFAMKPNVSGTEWSKVMNEYMEVFSVYAKAQQELNALQGQLGEEAMIVKYLEIRNPVDEFARKKMVEDPDNPFNIVLSTSTTPNMGFEKWDPYNLEVLKIVSEAFKKKFPDSPMSATMENQVYQIEAAYNEHLAIKSGSRKAPEITLKTPEGKILSLSSLKGKIVLIDFWASWCGPCRKENPNVVRLYNQYKDKGFTIYSVSLDEDAEAWKKAIVADGLIWPNHVSDLLGWKTPMTKVYGFNSIPHTVLIDREGNIIGTGLRGESLEQKLKEVISK